MTKEEKRMTKEEAIHILEYERDNDIFCSSYRHKVHIAMTMGVEALKELPISQRRMYQLGYRQAQKDSPKGEWKKATESIWECSLCNAIMFTTSNYCPNCGAVMRKGETNEG